MATWTLERHGRQHAVSGRGERHNLQQVGIFTCSDNQGSEVRSLESRGLRGERSEFNSLIHLCALPNLLKTQDFASQNYGR